MELAHDVGRLLGDGVKLTEELAGGLELAVLEWRERVERTVTLTLDGPVDHRAGDVNVDGNLADGKGPEDEGVHPLQFINCPGGEEKRQIFPEGA